MKNLLVLVSASNGNQIRSFKTDFGTDTGPAIIKPVGEEIFFSGDNGILYRLNKEMKIAKVFAAPNRINSILETGENLLTVVTIDGEVYTMKLN